MKYLLLVYLSVFSSTLMAERFHHPELHYKISNYTKLKTNELSVEFYWAALNGWGATIKSKDIPIKVNEDGSYTIPEINERAFSIWGVSFRSSLSIKDKEGKLIKIFYYVGSYLKNLALIDVESSDFEFSRELAKPEAYKAVMEVQANPETSTDGWVDLEARITKKSLHFPSSILVVPFNGKEDEIQFSFDLKMTAKEQSDKLLYADTAYLYRYDGKLGGDYNQNILPIPSEISRYIELSEPSN